MVFGAAHSTRTAFALRATQLLLTTLLSYFRLSSHFFLCGVAGWSESPARGTAAQGVEAAQLNAWQKIGDHPDAEMHEAIGMYQAARLLKFTYAKQHELSTEHIALLDRFSFLDADSIERLVGEKDEYDILTSNADAGYDLW